MHVSKLLLDNLVGYFICNCLVGVAREQEGFKPNTSSCISLLTQRQHQRFFLVKGCCFFSQSLIASLIAGACVISMQAQAILNAILRSLGILPWTSLISSPLIDLKPLSSWLTPNVSTIVSWFVENPHLPLSRCRLGGGSSLSPTYHSMKPSRASFIFIPLRAASDLKRNLSDSGISKRYSTSLSSCGTALNKTDPIIMPLLHSIIPVRYMSYMSYMRYMI